MHDKHPVERRRNIIKKKNNQDILPEYDFSKGMRGKYAARFAKGTNLVMLEPDVAKVFSNSEIVNETLRAVVKITRSSKLRNIEHRQIRRSKSFSVA